MIHVHYGDVFEAPPDGTFHVDYDEVLNLPVDLGAGNVDAVEASGPSSGMCFEVPDETSHVGCDKEPNLADNAEASTCHGRHS